MSVNHKPSSDGLKSKVDKTFSLEVAQTSPFLATSKEPSSNSRMNSFQAATKLLLPEIEDNSWIEDCSFSNIKLKDFLKEESTFQSKTKKVDLELWIILEFSIKKKTKSSNWKRKSKISNKDWEELQKDKPNLKKRSLDLMPLLEKFKTLTFQELILSHFWLVQVKSEKSKIDTIDWDHNWALSQVLLIPNLRNLELKESDLNTSLILKLYWETKISKLQL